MNNEYAKAGVDSRKVIAFKRMMLNLVEETSNFPERRGVINQGGGAFVYRGPGSAAFKTIEEAPGNKNWIAEWMYAFGDGKSYYNNIAIDTVLMAVNDLLVHGAMPVSYVDHIAAHSYDWFADEIRAGAFARGMKHICREVGMALTGGESAALKYLVRSKPPVTSAPVLSGAATGIIAPLSRQIFDNREAGDIIIAVASSGVHSSGMSLVIERAMQLKKKFMTELPSGRMLGEEILIPTRSYVALIEALQMAGVDIHAIVPGTGGGVAKLAASQKPLTYRIQDWLPVPPVMEWMQERFKLSLQTCITTFNWGAGYYLIVPIAHVARAVAVGEQAGYTLAPVGRVKRGERRVVFELGEGLILSPPGE